MLLGNVEDFWIVVVVFFIIEIIVIYCIGVFQI